MISAGRVLVEHHDGVDAVERGEELRALVLRRDRPARALVAPHRSIAVDADDQHIAERARRRCR